MASHSGVEWVRAWPELLCLGSTLGSNNVTCSCVYLCRIQALAEGSCMPAFQWAGGGTWGGNGNGNGSSVFWGGGGRPWTPDLPTDSSLVLYLFSALVDSPGWEFQLPSSSSLPSAAGGVAGWQQQQQPRPGMPLYLGQLPPRPPNQYTAVRKGLISINQILMNVRKAAEPMTYFSSHPCLEFFPTAASSHPGLEFFPTAASSHPCLKFFPTAASSHPGLEFFPTAASSHPGLEFFPTAASSHSKVLAFRPEKPGPRADCILALNMAGSVPLTCFMAEGRLVALTG